MAKRIGVLLSGRGSNFEALADSVAAGRIPDAEIVIIISNREGAPGIERARARGIQTRVIPSKGLEREAYDRQVVAVLQEKRVDLVCLAGFMRLLSPYFVAAYPTTTLPRFARKCSSSLRLACSFFTSTYCIAGFENGNDFTHLLSSKTAIPNSVKMTECIECISMAY